MSQDVDLFYVSPDVVIKTIPGSPTPDDGQTKVSSKIAQTIGANATVNVVFTIPANTKVIVSTLSGSLFNPTNIRDDIVGLLYYDLGGANEELIAVGRGPNINQLVDREFTAAGVDLTLRIENGENQSFEGSLQWNGFQESTS